MTYSCMTQKREQTVNQTMATANQLVISLEPGHSVVLRRGSGFFNVLGTDVYLTRKDVLAIFGEGIVGEWLRA